MEDVGLKEEIKSGILELEEILWIIYLTTLF